MIRGKKNFLPPSHLILGLSFLFRLEDSHIEKHKDERKILSQSEEDALCLAENEQSVQEVEVEILDESDGKRNFEIHPTLCKTISSLNKMEFWRKIVLFSPCAGVPFEKEHFKSVRRFAC